MPYGCENNRTFDVALAMQHRRKWFINLQARGLSEGDEHSLLLGHGTFYLFYQCAPMLLMMVLP